MTYHRTAATRPSPDELVIVALYRPDGRRQGYELCRVVDGEWHSDESGYFWSFSQGPLWTYFQDAPEHLDDVPAIRLAKMLKENAA